MLIYRVANIYLFLLRIAMQLFLLFMLGEVSVCIIFPFVECLIFKDI